MRKIFQGILKQIISKSGSRRDGADGEEQPQHVLVWGVSQELVVDHGGARRCFLSLLISFQNSFIGIFFGELPHRCIETDLSVGLDFLCRLKMRFAL